MGQRESRPQSESQGVEAPPDYYALLEVDENATADEIRVRKNIRPLCLTQTTRPTRNRSVD